MTFNKVMFSSLSDEWRTPQSLFDKLDKEFKFKLDPCSNEHYCLTQRTITKEENGLEHNWLFQGKPQSVFVNPPYGKEIDKWMKKGYEESLKGNVVVMIIPSRTDTKWWHNYVMKAKEIRFIKGRLKFSGHKNSAPFPSCVVIFR